MSALRTEADIAYTLGGINGRGVCTMPTEMPLPNSSAATHAVPVFRPRYNDATLGGRWSRQGERGDFDLMHDRR
jgi:hypothetical protein